MNAPEQPNSENAAFDNATLLSMVQILPVSETFVEEDIAECSVWMQLNRKEITDDIIAHRVESREQERAVMI